MIDEFAEVLEYLNGKRPTKKTEYRCIYLLARYCAELELDEQTATRLILHWGRHEVGYEFSIRVSHVVFYALAKPLPIRRGEKVMICQGELLDIKDRFRKPKMRLLALGLLAYAKAMADDNGVFDISIVGLNDWLGLNLSSTNRWLKVMEEEGFIERIPVRKRAKRMRTPITKMRMLMPYQLCGMYEISENDVFGLADIWFRD